METVQLVSPDASPAVRQDSLSHVAHWLGEDLDPRTGERCDCWLCSCGLFFNELGALRDHAA